ncbi:MAG: DNA polymerase III subunit epsilon [Steroidobacterales bacterium]|jgi:DNA polymerase-3 subunit epsilon
MRQIVLDTETTGLEPERGHRIIEIGCVELLNRRASGRTFHRYLNPDRDIDESARAIHGLTRERLASEPRFAQIADELSQFIAGSELVIHNASFDLAFLDMEFSLLASATPIKVRALCQVLDTLALARELHPGQRNNLDALCKRYAVDNLRRDLHGALLDARLLADVYLAMTGGQSALALGEAARAADPTTAATVALVPRPTVPLRVVEATPQERAAHLQLQELLQKASGGQCQWPMLEAVKPVATS